MPRSLSRRSALNAAFLCEMGVLASDTLVLRHLHTVGTRRNADPDDSPLRRDKEAPQLAVLFKDGLVGGPPGAYWG